jgi:hypothetical protein
VKIQMINEGVFTEFNGLKINIEDSFTQTEFSGTFPIKIHYLCRKNTKNL